MTIKYQIPSADPNIVRPTFKVPVLTDQNSTLEEICYWMKSFDHCASRMGFSDNAQELFFNFQLLLSGKALDEFEAAKEEVLGKDNPTVPCFHNVQNEWKHHHGFKPFQAEHFHKELHHLCKPEGMSISTFTS